MLTEHKQVSVHIIFKIKQQCIIILWFLLNCSVKNKDKSIKLFTKSDFGICVSFLCHQNNVNMILSALYRTAKAITK